MLPKICFITTGDIQSIATAKRALGLANPLSDLGWKVFIIMDDTHENHHRVKLECDKRTEVFFLHYTSAFDEIKKKNALLNKIKPDILYICAFVFRNIVTPHYKCIKLVEHSELQSKIKGISIGSKLRFTVQEYISTMYSDGLLNASQYLQQHFKKISFKFAKKNLPMLYFPYAYNKQICQINEKPIIPKYENDKFFVFLGSLAENYGAFVMIKAFELIHAEYPSFHLLLLGKGPDYTKVTQYIEEKGLKAYIHAQGFVKEEEISNYFSLADAFISPMNNTIQDWARCPSKLYMYLPYQKPIITCKIGEPYETLKSKGVYFEPSSEKSLTNVLRDLAHKNNWTLDIDPLLHEWKQRANELSNWLKTNFHQ